MITDNVFFLILWNIEDKVIITNKHLEINQISELIKP